MDNELIADAENEGDAVEQDNAFDQALANVDKQGEGENTSSESQTGNKQADKPSQEGDNTPAEQIPFHKHPRWIAMNQKNKELSEKLTEFEQKIKDVEPLLAQRQATSEPLPEWWKNAYGDTQESKDAYRTYQDNTRAERDRIKSEIFEEIQKLQESEVAEEKNATAYINGEIAEMKADGDEFETNELMRFIVEFQNEYGAGSLLDDQGNYDLRKALRLMNQFQPPEEDNSNETRKRLASNTINSKGSSQQEEVPKVSRRSLRGSWRDIE